MARHVWTLVILSLTLKNTGIAVILLKRAVRLRASDEQPYVSLSADSDSLPNHGCRELRMGQGGNTRADRNIAINELAGVGL